MEFDFNLSQFDKPPFYPGWMKENPKGKETDIFSSTMNGQLEEIIGVIKQLGDFLSEESITNLDCVCNLVGSLLDVDRKQRGNSAYYKAIQAKILENTAKANVESVLEILKFIYNEPGDTYSIMPNYPAGVKILYKDASGQKEPLDPFVPYMIGAGINYNLYPNWDTLFLRDDVATTDTLKRRMYFLDEIHYNKIRNTLPTGEEEFPYNGIVQHGIMAEERRDNKIGVGDVMRYQFVPLAKYNGEYRYDGTLKYNANWEHYNT